MSVSKELYIITIERKGCRFIIFKSKDEKSVCYVSLQKKKCENFEHIKPERIDNPMIAANL